MVFTAVWWLTSRRILLSTLQSAAWIVSSWFVAIAAVIGIHRMVDGLLVNPISFAAGFHQNREYLHQSGSSLWDRNLLYIFVWLLPTALPRLNKLPRAWRAPTAATAVMVFVLDAYYGGAPGRAARELFTGGRADTDAFLGVVALQARATGE